MGNKPSTDLKISMKEKLQHLNRSAIHLPARQDHPPKRPQSTPSLHLAVPKKERSSLPPLSSTPPPQVSQTPPPVLKAPEADKPTLLPQRPNPGIPNLSPKTTTPPSFIPAIEASPFAPSPFATSLPISENSTITPGAFHTISPPTFALSPPPSSDSSSSLLPLLSPTTSSHSHSSSNNPPVLSPPLLVTAPPVTARHLSCYQAHRNLLFSRNKFCPVPCMMCKGEDERGRWTCSWCSLRVCRACKGRIKETLTRDKVGVGGEDTTKGTEKEVGNDNPVESDESSDSVIKGEQGTAEGESDNIGSEAKGHEEEEDLTLGHW